MLVFISGVIAGTLHVVSGPDHLAAVAPLSAPGGRHGHSIGATWGLGHGGGALVWLLLAWLFRGYIHSDRIGLWAELCVGVSLLLVGVMALSARPGQRERAHAERHRTAFGFGILHGTAGAGHVLLALPTLGLAPAEAFGYVAGYFGAAVCAMACVGGLLSYVGARTYDTHVWSRICGAAAIIVGVCWLVDSWASVS